jgi:AcrR family transcriptional regulator
MAQPRQARRERVLGKARERFGAQGFARVTMDELAGELGMSKKTLYQLFPSKERLVQAQVRGFMHETEAGVRRLAERRDIPFADKLRELLHYLAQRLAQIGPLFLADLERHTPALWREVEEFRREKILVHFGRLVREGTAQGVFRKDADSELVMLVFLAAVQNVVTPRVLANLPLTAGAAFEGLVRLLMEGLLTEAGRRKYEVRTTKFKVRTEERRHKGTE